jgi:hypothetical protein
MKQKSLQKQKEPQDVETGVPLEESNSLYKTSINCYCNSWTNHFGETPRELKFALFINCDLGSGGGKPRKI